MRNYIAVALICLLSTLCPTSQVQGQRVLLCPQETLAETLRGEYAPVRQARYRWDPVGGARFQMPSLARRLRLLSQGRIDEIPYLPDGDAIDFQACLYRTRQVWEDTLALLNRGLHSMVLELVEAWDADSIRTRFGLSEKKFRKAEIGPVLNAYLHPFDSLIKRQIQFILLFRVGRDIPIDGIVITDSISEGITPVANERFSPDLGIQIYP